MGYDCANTLVQEALAFLIGGVVALVLVCYAVVVTHDWRRKPKAVSAVEHHVLRSASDERLHGYVGVIKEVRGHEALIEFNVKIRNEISSAWVNLRDLGLVAKPDVKQR